MPASPVVQSESLVDAALIAARGSRHAEAAALLSLVEERRGPRSAPAFALPEPDETWLWLAAGERRRAEEALRRRQEAAPASAVVPTVLRARLVLSRPQDVERLAADAARVSPSIPSLYERARTELELADALARTDEQRRARIHRVTADDLFALSGATGDRERPLASRLPPPRSDRPGPVAVPSAAAIAAEAGVDLPHAWADELTEREIHIVALVVQGRTNREVANRLHLSVRTVETHLGRVFAKLGVHSRTQLGYLAHRGDEPSALVSRY